MSMETVTGTETGRWRLNGRKLVVGGPEERVAILRTINRDSFELAYDGDRSEIWVRCKS